MDISAVKSARAGIGRVEIDGAEGWSPAGTAFLVASGKALTALHVVASRDDPQAAPLGDLRIVWSGGATVAAAIVRFDAAADWALLSFDPPGGDPLALGCDVPEEPEGWWTYGYPNLNAVDGVVARLDLLDPHAPYERGTAISLQSDDLKGTEVVGLSGAPLLHGGVVYGLFRSNLETARRSFGYLYATPIRQVLDRVDLGSAAPNPYQGMRPFEEGQTAYFFGRSRETEELAAKLTADPALRLAILLGGSGSGKSSLLKAGLIPQARRGRLDREAAFEVLALRPGSDPVRELALALSPSLRYPGAPGSLDQLVELLGSVPSALADLADQELHHRHGGNRRRGGFLLVVDQLEELFARDADTRQVTAFLQLIATAATTPHGRVWVAGALRDGFMTDLLDSRFDVATWNRALLPLGPLASEENLIELIAEPARKVGLRFEPAELPAAMAAEVAGEKGVLPLLQYALDRLWHDRRGNSLTRSAYDAFGGVRGAIAHQAEAVIGPLEGESLEAARRLFLRLVWIRSDGPSTRRLLPYASLPADLKTLAFRLVDQRLLVTTAAGIEIAHEALIREWPRLRKWVKEAPEAERRLQQLEVARQRWSEGGEKPDDRLPPHRFQPIAQWALSHPADVPLPERLFLVESCLESGLPPETWASPHLAEAIVAALDSRRERPPTEELRLVGALHAAAERCRVAGAAAESARIAGDAARHLERLLIREAGISGGSAAGLAAGSLAFQHEGPDWLIDLAERQPAVREIVAALLVEPAVRPQLLGQLEGESIGSQGQPDDPPMLHASQKRKWSGVVRRQAALRLAWAERTSLLFVALAVFLATLLLNQFWWLIDDALQASGLTRTSFRGYFGHTSLAILAALGTWLERWQRVVRRRVSFRELAFAALVVTVILDSSRLTLNLSQAIGAWSFHEGLANNLLFTTLYFLAYGLLLRSFALWVEAAAQDVPLSPAVRLGPPALAVGLPLAVTATLFDLEGWADVKFHIDLGLDFLDELTGILIALATAAWSAKAATRPTLALPRLPSKFRIGRAALGLLLLFLALGQLGGRLLVHFSSDPVRVSSLLRSRGDNRSAAAVLDRACRHGEVEACRELALDTTAAGRQREAAERGCALGDSATCRRWAELFGDDKAVRLEALVVGCENTSDPNLCGEAVAAVAAVWPAREIAMQARGTAAADDPLAAAERLCGKAVADACRLLAEHWSAPATPPDPARAEQALALGCRAGASELCSPAAAPDLAIGSRLRCADGDTAACGALSGADLYLLAGRQAENRRRTLELLDQACAAGHREACLEHGDRLARHRIAVAELRAIPPGMALPPGFAAQRLIGKAAEIPALVFPEAVSSLRLRESAGDVPWLTLHEDLLTPQRWWRDGGSEQDPEGFGAIVRLPRPLGDAPLAELEKIGLRAARSYLGKAPADPAGRAAWRTSLDPDRFAQAETGAAYLFRSWRRGEHDVLAELRTWPRLDQSVVVAWRILEEWPTERASP